MYEHLRKPHHPYRTEFRSVFEQYAERNGESIVILGEISDERSGEVEQVDPDNWPMYKIRFADGHETLAWPEEVRLDWYIPGDAELTRPGEWQR